MVGYAWLQHLVIVSYSYLPLLQLLTQTDLTITKHLVSISVLAGLSWWDFISKTERHLWHVHSDFHRSWSTTCLWYWLYWRSWILFCCSGSCWHCCSFWTNDGMAQRNPQVVALQRLQEKIHCCAKVPARTRNWIWEGTERNGSGSLWEYQSDHAPSLEGV